MTSPATRGYEQPDEITRATNQTWVHWGRDVPKVGELARPPKTRTPAAPTLTSTADTVNMPVVAASMVATIVVTVALAQVNLPLGLFIMMIGFIAALLARQYGRHELSLTSRTLKRDGSWQAKLADVERVEITAARSGPPLLFVHLRDEACPHLARIAPDKVAVFTEALARNGIAARIAPELGITAPPAQLEARNTDPTWQQPADPDDGPGTAFLL